MCRMLMVTAAQAVRIDEEAKRFFEASRVHRHGWGWAEFSHGRIRSRRETQPAHDSAYLRELLGAPLETKSALFHVRYATVGAIGLANTHPVFAMDVCGRQWAAIHNGTIFDGERTDRFFHAQNGDSDTERLLLYIVERINEATMNSRLPLDEKQRFRVVDRALRAVAPGNKLNVVLGDSELFYVHGNSRHGARLLGDYGRDDYLYELDLSEERGAPARVFSTVPLDGRDWHPVPLNTVRAYKDGELLFAGEPHGHEYTETEDDMKRLYQGFAEL
jgi:glutamine amidotransferase